MTERATDAQISPEGVMCLPGTSVGLWSLVQTFNQVWGPHGRLAGPWIAVLELDVSAGSSYLETFSKCPGSGEITATLPPPAFELKILQGSWALSLLCLQRGTEVQKGNRNMKLWNRNAEPCYRNIEPQN